MVMVNHIRADHKRWNCRKRQIANRVATGWSLYIFGKNRFVNKGGNPFHIGFGQVGVEGQA